MLGKVKGVLYLEETWVDGQRPVEVVYSFSVSDLHFTKTSVIIRLYEKMYNQGQRVYPRSD